MSPLKPDLDRLRILCESARTFAGPSKVETFFSIGGRGYYENPASDLLAFFMTKGSHGMEAAFLGGLMECHHQIDLNSLEAMLAEPVRVEREKRTDGGNRLDLRILGKTWALVIENKIRHWVANPLDEYEETSIKWAGNRKLYLMILSPAGGSPNPEKWIPVTYRHLASRVRERMEATMVPADSSKWRVFAEDFLLHIEQEVSLNLMNQEETKFIEEHLVDLPTIQRLRNDYMHHLWRLIHAEMEAGEIPHLELKWESKYFLIVSDNWRQWQIGLSGPDQLNPNDDGLLAVRIWGISANSELERIQNLYFPDFEEAGTDGPFKEFRRAFKDSSEALGEIRRVAAILIGPSSTRKCLDEPILPGTVTGLAD